MTIPTNRFYRPVGDISERKKKKKIISFRFSKLSKLKNIIAKKDHKSNLKNIAVFMMSCMCGQCYVGQTGHSTEVRIKEHQYDFWMRKITYSVVMDNKIDFDNATLLWEALEVVTSFLTRIWTIRSRSYKTKIFLLPKDLILLGIRLRRCWLGFTWYRWNVVRQVECCMCLLSSSAYRQRNLFEKSLEIVIYWRVFGLSGL